MHSAKREGRVSSETIPGFFAGGINFYKLFWVFMLAAFIGAVVETLFMLLSRGELQNRSGVLFGPFSLVWGVGGVLFTLCFPRLQSKRDLWVFLAGTLVGGAYEYVCSWLQEVLFGACFWDYSHIPLNINGRVSLLYSMFWGVAAVLWVKDIYPRMCRWIGKIPNRCGKPLTWVLAVLMAGNVALSAAALARMDARQLGAPPRGAVDRYLDQHWPDARLYRVYSNLVYVGTPETRTSAGLTGPPAWPG